MTEDTSDESVQQERPFQFRIRSLLVLTTVCAVAAAIAKSLQVPIVSQVVVAVFLMLLAAYAVLRLPFICSRIWQRFGRLKRLRHQRAELQASVSAQQQQIQQAKSRATSDSAEDGSAVSESNLPATSTDTVISFGDNVRVRDTPATVAAGLAGLSGSVSGHTTPSVTGVEVIGDLLADFAVNVHFTDRGESYWFAEQLLEFVDHAPGTEIQLAGVPKKWVRTESGQWQEIGLADEPVEPWQWLLKRFACSTRFKVAVISTAVVTLVVEVVTLYLRFGRGQTATEFNKTAPLLLQIHHMFWSVPLLAVLPFVWRRPRASGTLLGIALGFVISDLLHHCVVLPLTVGNMGWHWP